MKRLLIGILCCLIVFVLATPASASSVLGDVNNSGSVHVHDASLLIHSIVGLTALDEDQEKAADVRYEGRVTISDAISILRHITGLPLELNTIDRRYCEDVSYRISGSSITLAWGEKRTSGYYIEIEDITFLDDEMYVHYNLWFPPIGSALLMIITYPWVDAMIEEEYKDVHLVLNKASYLSFDNPPPGNWSPFPLW